MEIKTKTELLAMSQIDLEKEENIAWDYFKKPEKLDNWFWMIKRSLGMEEKRWFVWVVLVLYSLIARGL